MARYIGPVCRLCRREGMKLFLKGERCYTEKCAIEKRNFPPGRRGHRHRPQPEESDDRARDGGSERTRHPRMALVRRRLRQWTDRLDADAGADQPARAGTADCGALFEVRSKK